MTLQVLHGHHTKCVHAISMSICPKGAVVDEAGGFTLIEVAVFIVVLSILGLVSYQVLWDNTYSVANVKACRESLVAELRFLQASSRGTELIFRATLTTSDETVTLEQESGGSWSSIKAFTAECNLVSTTLSSNIIAFRSGFAYEGSWAPSSIPSSPISSDKVITLGTATGGSDQATITISKVTGLIQ